MGGPVGAFRRGPRMTDSAPLSSPPAVSRGPRRVSVVVAVYYEQECIDEFITQASAELDKAAYDWEIVFVDDGSTDRTVEMIVAAIGKQPRLRLVELAYNHGKAFALTAGIRHASGTHIVCMDPDLQDPIEYIPRFVDELDKGFDLVFGVREEKRDTILNVIFSKIFWFVLRRLTRLDLPVGLATMRSFNRGFADQYLSYPESNRFLEGLFMHVGMRRTQIDVPHRDRFAGKTKFNLRRKMALAFDAICDFSDIPLRLATRAGLVLTLIGIVAVIGVVVARTFVMEFEVGWPSLFSILTVGFGVNLFFLGVIGKYVGNTYREVKRRPLYAVRALHNVPEPRS